MSLSDYMELVELWENCPTHVGFCVFGDLFFTNGIKEMDKMILPQFTAQSGTNVIAALILMLYFIGLPFR